MLWRLAYECQEHLRTRSVAFEAVLENVEHCGVKLSGIAVILNLSGYGDLCGPRPFSGAVGLLSLFGKSACGSVTLFEAGATATLATLSAL